VRGLDGAESVVTGAVANLADGTAVRAVSP
jgi:hypothetical protein